MTLLRSALWQHMDPELTTPSLDRVLCTLRQFRLQNLCHVSVGVHDRMRTRIRWVMQTRLNDTIAFLEPQIRTAIQRPAGEP